MLTMIEFDVEKFKGSNDEGNFEEANITDDSKWNETNHIAIDELNLVLVDGISSSVAQKKIANEIWDTLTRTYEAKSLHNMII